MILFSMLLVLLFASGSIYSWIRLSRSAEAEGIGESYDNGLDDTLDYFEDHWKGWSDL